MKSAHQLKSHEHDRSVVYRKLADVFRLPGPDHPKALEELSQALEHLGSDAMEDAHRLGKAFDDGKTKEPSLEVEYTRLFVGPFHTPAPPFGSVYLEQARRLMGDSTMDAREHYLSLGLDLASDLNEAPDHVSTELEFMYVLIRRSIAHIETADYDALSQIVSHQRLFLGKHLGAWVTAFSDKILEHTQTAYFRILASVLRTFVVEDLELLPILSEAQSTSTG